MEESSSTSFHQGQRDDSGYGSPIFHQEYSSPQTLNSPYYSYAHNYHQHLNAYGNSSFQLYDPSLMVHQNLYSSGSTPFSLIHRNEQSPTTDLSAIPILDTTNPKELVETNPCPAYDYKINWGKFKVQLEFSLQFESSFFLFHLKFHHKDDVDDNELCSLKAMFNN